MITTDPYVPATIRNQPITKKMAEAIMVVHQNLVRAARQLSQIHMYVSVWLSEGQRASAVWPVSYSRVIRRRREDGRAGWERGSGGGSGKRRKPTYMHMNVPSKAPIKPTRSLKNGIDSAIKKEIRQLKATHELHGQDNP